MKRMLLKEGTIMEYISCERIIDNYVVVNKYGT